MIVREKHGGIEYYNDDEEVSEYSWVRSEIDNVTILYVFESEIVLDKLSGIVSDKEVENYFYENYVVINEDEEGKG